MKLKLSTLAALLRFIASAQKANFSITCHMGNTLRDEILNAKLAEIFNH
jgi:hypothetical protein